MKCPQCLTGNKNQDKICKTCRYHFALDPNEGMKIGDYGFSKIVDKISDHNRYYYTYNQLYAELYKYTKRKARKQKTGGIVALSVITLIISIILGSAFHKFYLGLVVFLFGGVFIFWFARTAVKGKQDAPIAETITQYQKLHPLEKMVNGSYFKDAEAAGRDPLLMDYAPERILIVERDDIADMLILNRFHLDNKALVLSAQKYPAPAFEAYGQILGRYPDTRVSILHDASKEGLKMKESLASKPIWSLQGKEIQDLGLSPQDAAKLEDPVWRRGPRSGGFGAVQPMGKTAEENIQMGMRMPVDVAPPHLFMGAAAVAAVLGVALLSDELLAAQKKQEKTGEGDGGGSFG